MELARLQSVSAQFDLAIKGTQAEISKAIVATARREHEKIMRAAPQPTGFQRIVDGSRGAPLEQVKKVVVFEYQRLDLVVQFAMETLFEKSPVLTGEYRNAHTIFLDGVAVKNLEGWKPGSTVIIANFVPYSRVIEVGHHPGMAKWKLRVPGTDHVYQQAEQIVNARYGNLARTRFTYTGVVGGKSQAYSEVALGGRKGGKTASAEKRAANALHNDNRWPALSITER